MASGTNTSGYLGYNTSDTDPGALGIDLHISNQTQSSGDDFDNPFDYPAVKFCFICLYAVVFFVCCVGNSLLLYTIGRTKRMRTRTNFFLANLAVADLAVGVVCVLPKLSTYLSPTWVLGEAMCKIYYFAQSMTYTATVLFLTAIAVERYIAILHPMRSRCLVTQTKLVVSQIGIWVVSIAYNSPELSMFNLFAIRTDNGTTLFCFPTKPYTNMRNYYTFNFGLWYILPLSTMTVLYLHMAWVLWKSGKQVANDIRLLPITNRGQGGHGGQGERTTHAEMSGFARNGHQQEPKGRLRANSFAKNGKNLACAVCCHNMMSKSTVCPSRLNLLLRCSDHGHGLLPCRCRRGSNDSDNVFQDGEVENKLHPGYNGVETRNIKACSKGCRTASCRSGSSNSTMPSPANGSIGCCPGFHHSDHNGSPPCKCNTTTTSTCYRNHHSPQSMRSTCMTSIRSNNRRCSANSNLSVHYPETGYKSKEQASGNSEEYDMQVPTPSAPTTRTTGFTRRRVQVQCRINSERILEARKRVIRLLVVVVLTFAVCVLPYHLKFLLLFWHVYPTASSRLDILSPLAFVFLYANSALNPILFWVFSGTFRRSLRESCRRNCCIFKGKK